MEPPLESVLAEYGPGRWSVRGPLESGYQTDNWLVESADGARCVLKRLTLEGSAPHALMELLHGLRREGVPVPPPFRTALGAWFVQRDSAWVLNGLLEGDPAAATQVDVRLEQIGRELGRLHRASLAVAARSPVVREELGPSPPEVFARWFEPWRGSEPWVSDAYARVRSELADVSSGLTRTALNGDLGPHSFLFSGDQLTGVLDFGAACHWFALFDVASCLMYTSTYLRGRSSELARLLDGYATTAPVGDRDFDSLPIFLRTRALVQVGYFDWRLRSGVTQGNDEAENREGYSDGLDFLRTALEL